MRPSAQHAVKKNLHCSDKQAVATVIIQQESIHKERKQKTTEFAHLRNEHSAGGPSAGRARRCLRYSTREISSCTSRQLLGTRREQEA